MQSDIYFQYNPWWETNWQKQALIARPVLEAKLRDALEVQSIVFLTGLRRVGKTSLMKILIYSLVEKGINPAHICYLSLDDYLFESVSITDIVNEYRKIQKISFDTKVYLFLDEITYKDNFRIQLKNIYDKQNAKVFVSSSTSSALRDKKGFLTGREHIIEISPLFFNEFLQFQGITVKQSDNALLESYFEQYMQMGGMPEYVLHKNREYLTELVDDILLKDIVAYHGVKDPYLIRDYFMLLMERAGKQISINKVAKILSISPDSAKRYLHMFEDAFLIYLVPRFGKTNEMLLSPKKVYSADLGIRNIFTGFRDKGAIFENIVFSIIKPLMPRYVYQNKIELDFMTNNKILIEAKYGRELEGKQLALYNDIKASKKIVVNSLRDLIALEELVK